MPIEIPTIQMPSFDVGKSSLIRERKSILILGNGFDLCAGLKSSFSSFAKSNFWPLKGGFTPGSLPAFLNDKKNINTWFDLEQELFGYAHNYNHQVRDSNLEIDKKAFSDLHKALIDYLKDQESSFVPQSQLPYVMIQFFQALPGKNKLLYTFNYTSPETIIKRLGGEVKVPVRYVHGSLEDNNIVIGVGDKNELYPTCHYLYKAMSPHYKSTDIVSELDGADDVFFFGHSLGINDYDYFNRFFLQACERRSGLHPNLRITVFAKNQDDQITIKSRIRELADKKLQRLINMCEFNIASTDDEPSFREYLAHYLERSISEYKSSKK